MPRAREPTMMKIFSSPTPTHVMQEASFSAGRSCPCLKRLLPSDRRVVFVVDISLVFPCNYSSHFRDNRPFKKDSCGPTSHFVGQISRSVRQSGRFLVSLAILSATWYRISFGISSRDLRWPWSKVRKKFQLSLRFSSRISNTETRSTQREHGGTCFFNRVQPD